MIVSCIYSLNGVKGIILPKIIDFVSKKSELENFSSNSQVYEFTIMRVLLIFILIFLFNIIYSQQKRL